MEQMILSSLFSGPFFTIKNGLIVALIVGFLCLLLLIAFVWYYIATRMTDDDIKNIIKDSIRKPHGQVHETIKDMVLKDDDIMDYLSSRSHSNQSLTQQEIEKIVQQRVDKAMEDILRKQRNEMDQLKIDTTRPLEDGIKLNPLVLYASCVDENKHSFYSVTKLPDKDTIFVLELNRENEDEATYTVFDKVYKKVIEEQGHLREGCFIENPDMNKTTLIKTIVPGLTYRKNGEWVIKEKARVRFE